MGFYNSGLRRLTGAASTARAKVDANTKSDTDLAAAVAVNTAKTGITVDQAGKIADNSAKVSMVIGTGAEQAMAGNSVPASMLITGDGGGIATFSMLESGHIVMTLEGATYTIKKDE
jgi:hypothetical protein